MLDTITTPRTTADGETTTPVYQMLLTQRPDGQDVATITFDGEEMSVVTRHGATLALARLLVAKGAPDGRWIAKGSSGHRRLYGRSLHALARLTISEDDRGLRVVAFQPFTGH